MGLFKKDILCDLYGTPSPFDALYKEDTPMHTWTHIIKTLKLYENFKRF